MIVRPTAKDKRRDIHQGVSRLTTVICPQGKQLISSFACSTRGGDERWHNTRACQKEGSVGAWENDRDTGLLGGLLSAMCA